MKYQDQINKILADMLDLIDLVGPENKQDKCKNKEENTCESNQNDLQSTCYKHKIYKTYT